MKRLLFAFALLLGAVSVSQARSLVLTLSDGTLVYYLLGGETNPKMTFDGGQFTVDADRYSFSGVKNFYISETDDPTAVAATDAGAAITQEGNMFVVRASQARVYDIKGVEQKADVRQDGERVRIDLGQMPTGAYIIRTAKTSFKVVKK